ncbi:MAG: TolC family protein [Bacteroidales bacterium]|nr:TolC family protein [Bacteroidales bacterium]
MNREGKTAIAILTFIFTLLYINSAAIAQDEKRWTLRECIDYAIVNNIEVKQSKLTVNSTREDLMQAKASKLPSLGFSSAQNFSAQKSENSSGDFKTKGSYSGSYALNTSITLYNGGKLVKNQKQQNIAVKMDELALDEQQNSIEISVTRAYLDILYANENLKTLRKSVELSEIQTKRTKALYEAGAKSSVDYAQMEAQLSTDRYQLTVGENTLAQSVLALKQLLEIDVNEKFTPYFPDPEDISLQDELPELTDVYKAAIEGRPEVKSSLLQIESAKVGEKIARADYLPSVTANASIGTGNLSGSGYSLYNQLNNKLNENVGVSLSIPIFSKRSTKTAVNKAQYQIEMAELSSINVKKNLLSTIESLYQDARSAQSRYKAAVENLKYTELSYTQVQEQYNEGIKNTVELLSERQAYLYAMQEKSQSKYQALLSLKLLQFYQNQPIDL